MSRRSNKSIKQAQYSKNWRDKNNDHVAEYEKNYRGLQEAKGKRKKARHERYLRDKRKKFLKMMTHKRYERKHPDRIKKYYQDNKVELLAKQKVRRSKKNNP